MRTIETCHRHRYDYTVELGCPGCEIEAERAGRAARASVRWALREEIPDPVPVLLKKPGILTRLLRRFAP